MSTTTNLHPMGSLRLTGGQRPTGGYDMTPRLDMHKRSIARGPLATKADEEKERKAKAQTYKAPKRRKKSFLAEWRPFLSGAW